MPPRKSSSSSGAVAAAAAECIAQGNYYEALQVYHGLCVRSTLAGDVEGAEATALEGIRAMLAQREWRCADELVTRLLDSWGERDRAVDETAVATVRSLADLFPCGSDEHCGLLKRACKWADHSNSTSASTAGASASAVAASSGGGGGGGSKGSLSSGKPASGGGGKEPKETKAPSGSGGGGKREREGASSRDKATPPPAVAAAEALHLMLARALIAGAGLSRLGAAAKVGKYGLAAHYLARARAPDEYASLVEVWAAEGLSGETDLFVCRGCLHLLAMRRPTEAAHVRTRCLADDSPLAPPRGSADWRLSPLCHFVELLLQLVLLAPRLLSAKKKEAASTIADVYGVLRERYLASLKRDSGGLLVKLADHAAQLHLGVKPPPATGMASMMSQMLGGTMNQR